VYTNYREELERSLIPHFATWVTELTTLNSRRTEDEGSDTGTRTELTLAILLSCRARLNRWRIASVAERLMVSFAIRNGNSAILADLNAVKPLPSDSTLLIVCMACAHTRCDSRVITWGTAGWEAQGPAMRVLVFSPILLTLVASVAAAEPVMSFSVGGAMESADSVLDSSTKVVDHHQIALEAV
jgi:hypothetical protein